MHSSGGTFPTALTVVLLLLAGCASSPPSNTPDPRPMQYFPHPGLGFILAAPNGRVVYVFTNDEPGKSNCYDVCAEQWPPYIVDEEPEGPGDISGDLGLVTRSDGQKQAAYRDRPLYHWMMDEKAGDATGDGSNGVWFVVRQPPGETSAIDGGGELVVDAGNVTYHGSTQGYFAVPNHFQSPTGIVLIHEWWGLNDNIRNMAELLASNGYMVLAVDLFEGKVATTSQEAQAQVAGLDQSEATSDMRAAADYLRGRGAQEIVSFGWCFGGGQSLRLALSGEELAATVIYYGSLETDQAKLEPIKWPVLAIFGEKDQVISVANVRAFEKALGNLTVETEIYIYPDVGHAFANPTSNWAAEEAQDAWARTLIFLARRALAVD